MYLINFDLMAYVMPYFWLMLLPLFCGWWIEHWGRCFASTFIFSNGRCCCHSVFCGMVGHYIACYSIWRWQMLMASGRCNNHFFYIIKRWQMLLTYWDQRKPCLKTGKSLSLLKILFGSWEYPNYRKKDIYYKKKCPFKQEIFCSLSGSHKTELNIRQAFGTS